MIYKVRYTFLNKEAYVYSPEKMDLNKPCVAEIDGQKYYINLLEEKADHSVETIKYGENNIIKQVEEVDEVHYDLQVRRCRHFVHKVNDAAQELDSSCRVVACEPLFDVRRLIFYFKFFEKIFRLRPLIKTARELVKTQVDFQQVSGRDIAKLVPTMAICGEQTCCSRFLYQSPVIKNDEAKAIWARPQQSIGLCGRIKCCALFEKKCKKCPNK